MYFSRYEHSINTGSHRHYDDSTTADVIIVLGPDDAIYAHRMFLAVGSEHFEDQLRDPEYMVRHHA